MKLEVIQKFSDLVTAAFGLVAALAWNAAIQQIFKNIFGEQSSVAAMLGYAITITLIAVIFTLYIGRLSDRAKNRVLTRQEAKKK